MNWKQSLDRYLTTPPNDGFTNYCENVTEAFTENFFNENESWILDETEQIDKWLSKLYYNSVNYKKAAATIERAFKLYKL